MIRHTLDIPLLKKYEARRTIKNGWEREHRRGVWWPQKPRKINTREERNGGAGTPADGFWEPNLSELGQRLWRRETTGDPESLKKEKEKRYTYAFSDSMVLQKVLMATEVEQREFCSGLTFCKICMEGIFKKKKQKFNHKSLFFFYMCKFTFRFVLHSSALEARIFFFFFLTFLLNRPTLVQRLSQ